MASAAVHDRREPGPADAIHGLTRHLHRQARLDRRLPGDVHARACLQDAAQHHVIDFGRAHACPRHGFLHDDRTKVRRAERRKRPAEGTDRRAAGRKNDDGHQKTPTSLMMSGAPVAAWIASTVVSSARSFSTRPSGVTSITAISVTTRCTTFAPVSGRVHWRRIFELAVLRRVLHRDNHAPGAGHQIHRAAHPLHHLPGDHPVGKVALPDRPAARRAR